MGTHLFLHADANIKYYHSNRQRYLYSYHTEVARKYAQGFGLQCIVLTGMKRGGDIEWEL